MKRYETDVRDGVLYLEAPVESESEGASDANDGEAEQPDGESAANDDDDERSGGEDAVNDGDAERPGDEAARSAEDRSDDEQPADASAATGDSRWLEIGSMDAVVELIGGETYELQYGRRQKQVGWLDTDEDGTLSFDVRETVRTTTFDDEFVRNVAGVPGDETNEDGHPQRAAVFADLLTTIWDSKGNLQDA